MFIKNLLKMLRSDKSIPLPVVNDSPESVSFREEMNDFIAAYLKERPSTIAMASQAISESELLSGPAVIETEGVTVK